MNVGEKDGHVDNVFQFEARGFEDFLNIIERRGRLGPMPPAANLPESSRTLLTCDVQSIARHDAVAERKVPCGGQIDGFAFLAIGSLRPQRLRLSAIANSP